VVERAGPERIEIPVELGADARDLGLGALRVEAWGVWAAR
jgi:hypothetical protein